jgi:hypothetical protein
MDLILGALQTLPGIIAFIIFLLVVKGIFSFAL